ncbi:MAG: HIT domain-containing protein [Chitinophagia bacterium]|jgi:histidine triad (HIT) family protein|nr:HIT domain-containing protein [Chitinophagia bacterium]
MTLFTKIIQGEIPSYKIAESNLFYAFLDIFPLQKGHTLVVPKCEVDKIFDVPDTYLTELLLFAKPIAKALEASFECNRVGIVTVGLEVPHAHLHLIPINQAKDMEFSGPKLSFTKEEMIAIQQEIVSKLIF